jgi:hypothetical protein
MMALASMILLWATPGDPHKLLWCHYPPGQWTGVPGEASHVIILDIDVAAPGFDKITAKHLGHSPEFPNGDKAEGPYENGNCPGACGTAFEFAGIDEGTGDPIFEPVNLIPVEGQCVCPTQIQGQYVTPTDTDPTSGVFLECPVPDAG